MPAGRLLACGRPELTLPSPKHTSLNSISVTAGARSSFVSCREGRSTTAVQQYGAPVSKIRPLIYPSCRYTSACGLNRRPQIYSPSAKFSCSTCQGFRTHVLVTFGVHATLVTGIWSNVHNMISRPHVHCATYVPAASPTPRLLSSPVRTCHRRDAPAAHRSRLRAQSR